MAEATVNAPAADARGDDGAPRLAPCKAIPDFYLPPSRALIGSLCRSFLDQMALTPTELLYSSRNHTRLEGAGNLLREAVERAGTMQARAVGEPAPNRVKELQALLEQMSNATRELEAKEPVVALKAGGFRQAVAAILQQIAGTGPMSSPELMLELKSTYSLLQRLRAGDKVIGGRRALEFIDKRMGKLLNEETIGDYIRGGGTHADRVIALLEIHALTFGPNNKKTVEG